MSAFPAPAAAPSMPSLDADLPFGPDDPALAALVRDAEAAMDAAAAQSLTAPIYVGGVDAGQRGVFGPITLELLLDDQRVELGPFVLPKTQVARLWRLLGVALDVLGEPRPTSRPAPLPESGRGIVGWDLARNLTGLTAASHPWEGETRP